MKQITGAILIHAGSILMTVTHIDVKAGSWILVVFGAALLLYGLATERLPKRPE